MLFSFGIAVIVLLLDEVEEAGDMFAVLLSDSAGDGLECSECGDEDGIVEPGILLFLS